MHSPELRNQFFVLRARGMSLAEISRKLDVPKSTLGDWNTEHLAELMRERAIKFEDLETQVGFNIEHDLLRLLSRLRICEHELDKRRPDLFSNRELLRVINATREYYRRRQILMASLESPRFYSAKPDKTGRFPDDASANPSQPATSENPDSASSGFSDSEGQAPLSPDSQTNSEPHPLDPNHPAYKLPEFDTITVDDPPPI